MVDEPLEHLDKAMKWFIGIIFIELLIGLILWFLK